MMSLSAANEALLNLSVSHIALILVGGGLTYQVILAVWNLSPFHPLSHIPGPRLAAATYLPEFYYDTIKYGRYTQQIKKMHEKYGPMVRINPSEVHCADYNFIDEIYAVGGRKRNKPIHENRGSTIEYAGFATSDHDLHRMRRGALSKFFSRAQIGRLEPEIRVLVQRLCDKLLRESGKAQPLDVTMAYSCFTSDTISDYCFGQSFGFLAQDSWYPNYRAATYAFLQTVYVFRYFPFLRHLSLAASWLSKYMSNDMALMIKTIQTDIPNQIQRTKAEREAGLVSTGKRQTVFGELLASSLPEREKSMKRIADEAAAVLAAGTETTSWTLSVITYHLLAQPAQLAKLTAELRGAGLGLGDPEQQPELPVWTALERLPYLGAVIQEGLRLSYGVSARTARVATHEDLVYRGEWTPPPHGREKPVVQRLEYVIPRGYAVGMSSAISHHDEGVWPDSHAFAPERWLDDRMQRRKELERCQMAFSKGSRACIGMQLAYCELHLCLAALTLRVIPRMRLYETTELDVRYDHDMFVPLTHKNSKGVRVLVD
ncbi:trichodiene oxygenase [Apiospora arundinis]|uniref:Trichodiene oxygenase n=1 Tax=Apiospora arundinis TaxID=335852 RepID=A0ABR2JD88_9PEZI